MTDATQKRNELESTIRRVLERNHLAVLATQHLGQPHASLMAFSYLDDLHTLIFATYRATRKYRSLLDDGRVALLIYDENGETAHPGQRIVITAVGLGSEVPQAECSVLSAIHLARHPALQQFLDAPDCALVRVAVEAYQVVGAIDDVQWYRVA